MPNKRADGRTTTTISVDRGPWAAAKRKAAGRPMSAVIGALLAKWVAGEITLPGDQEGT